MTPEYIARVLAYNEIDAASRQSAGMMVTDPVRDASAVEASERSQWHGQRMTLDEFLKLPDETPHLEYDDGLVTQKMAAKPTHASIQASLVTAFNQVAGLERLGLALAELRFVSPNWAPVPDVAYYRRERIKMRGRRLPADFFEPPDIAVEIVSPDQSVTELIRKCLRYIALGSQVALLIDPDPETVLVFREEQPLRLLQGDDRIDLDDVLPGFELTVRAMFDSLAPDWLIHDAEESTSAEQPPATE